MSWKQLISGCFGSASLSFAGHPSDRARAITMMETAHAQGASEQDVADELVVFLNVRNASSSHIQRQLDKFHQGWFWII